MEESGADPDVIGGFAESIEPAAIVPISGAVAGGAVAPIIAAGVPIAGPGVLAASAFFSAFLACRSFSNAI